MKRPYHHSTFGTLELALEDIKKMFKTGGRIVEARIREDVEKGVFRVWYFGKKPIRSEEEE